MTWDTGYVPLAALGDYVWDDRNHNGLQEPNEPTSGRGDGGVAGQRWLTCR